jgi:glutamine synthetase
VAFVSEHGLWDEAQRQAAAEVAKRIEADGLEQVRFSFPDQHGILRGKTLMAGAVESAFDTGVNIVTTLLAKDTSHRTVFPVWSDGGGLGMDEMTGAGDFVMVADPTTFKVLPWAPGTGWVMCDIYFADGTPVPFATRQILRTAIDEAAQKGFDYRVGLEVEFHLFKLTDPKLSPQHGTQPATPPEVELLAHGFNYLTETRFDELEPMVAHLRRALQDLDLPLRSSEVEFGPSQCEMTFQPLPGFEAGDAMTLFRSAVKQVARRHGCLATFMCLPHLPNMFASGWHLHQSLAHPVSGDNLFVPGDGDEILSETGRQFIAGLIEHAGAGSAFAAPTINAYKRYQPNSLAPDRAAWGRDNRGVMLRALGGPGNPATRIENRAGEPAANPYLYLASQLLAGLDGIVQQKVPPPFTRTPYDNPDAPTLPRSLMDAVDRSKLGDKFVDYFVFIKRAEISRFLSTVTDWEQAEYFEMF